MADTENAKLNTDSETKTEQNNQIENEHGKEKDGNLKNSVLQNEAKIKHGTGLGMGKKGISIFKKIRKNRRSRSSRAGLSFSVSRLHRNLKKGEYAPHISADAPVYLAAVMEYMVAELGELAGTAAKDNGKKTITPRFINMAIQTDDEISKLLRNVIVSGGGVVPYIHKQLLPKANLKKKKRPTKKQSKNAETEDEASEEEAESK